MTVDPAVIPGLLILAAEVLALAAVGYVVARVALRQPDHRLALAQGLVIGPALWGLSVNFILHVLPGMSGALAGWVLVLGLAGGLACRTRQILPVPPRTLAGFGLAGAVIFWIALASRQLLIIPDEAIHTSLAATIRAGAWPPALSWNPDVDFAYHYAIDLLIGLLMPPVGPDLGLTTEVLGAYAWTSLIMLVIALVMRRGSWAGTLALTPLLLAPGAWTLVFGEQPSLLRLPIPAGLPAPGVRDALTNLYWPWVELPWPSEQHSVPPNIWKPPFPLAYALAFVGLERVSIRENHRWPAALTLALLIGFLALVDETVAPVVLVMWIAMESYRLLRRRRSRYIAPASIMRAAAGPALAAALMAVGGGVLTGALTGIGGTGDVSIGWPLDPRERAALASISVQGGGLGLFEAGSIVAVAIAVLLAARNRLIVLLAGGAVIFLIAALTVRYESAPHDIARFDGHARNFALLSLILALALRLAALPRLPRYGAAAVAIGLVTWPSIAAPARSLGLAVGHGVEIANATAQSRDFGDWYWYMGRHYREPSVSSRISAWVRNHSPHDARILSPEPLTITVATGRPNASGFGRFPHQRLTYGPEYLDSIRYLEPMALAQLGVQFIHAPDYWVIELPDRAKRWLADARLFEQVLRDGDQTLYRVRPEFYDLAVPPTPGSYEALGLTAPERPSVFLSPATDPLNTVRVVASIPNARFVGAGNQSTLYVQDLSLRTPIRPQPFDGSLPDLAVASARLAPAMFPADLRRPVFWNSEIAVYSPDGSVAPVMPPPPASFQVEMSDWHTNSGRLAFTATLANLNAEGWTGQDWVVVRADTSPWAFPDSWPVDKTPQWFAGQIAPQSGTLVHRYQYDPKTGELALRNSESSFITLPSAGNGLGPGVWLLSVRLRDDYSLVALAPVARIVIAEAGDVSFQVYQGEIGVQPTAGPATSPRGRL